MTIQLSAAAAVFDRPYRRIGHSFGGASSKRIHPHSKSSPETILITRDVQMLPYAKLEVYLLREVFRCSPANSTQIRSTVADVQQLLKQLDAHLRTSRSFHQILLEQLQRKDIADSICCGPVSALQIQ